MDDALSTLSSGDTTFASKESLGGVQITTSEERNDEVGEYRTGEQGPKRPTISTPEGSSFGGPTHSIWLATHTSHNMIEKNLVPEKAQLYLQTCCKLLLELIA